MLTGCGGFRELPRTPGSGRATLPPTRFDRAGQVVVPRAVDAVHVPAQVAVRPPSPRRTGKLLCQVQGRRWRPRTREPRDGRSGLRACDAGKVAVLQRVGCGSARCEAICGRAGRSRDVSVAGRKRRGEAWLAPARVWLRGSRPTAGAVKVVRPVGRCTLTAPAWARLGGQAGRGIGVGGEVAHHAAVDDVGEVALEDSAGLLLGVSVCARWRRSLGARLAAELGDGHQVQDPVDPPVVAGVVAVADRLAWSLGGRGRQRRCGVEAREPALGEPARVADLDQQLGDRPGARGRRALPGSSRSLARARSARGRPPSRLRRAWRSGLGTRPAA